MVKRLLALLVAGVVAVAGLTAVASPAHASTIGGDITRSEVMARAQYWVDHQPGPYNQGGFSPGPGGDRNYRRDCSGYVDMAWHLGADYTTFTLGQVSTAISRADLRPGDILLDAAEHTFIFKSWANTGHTAMNYYSFGSTPVKVKLNVSMSASTWDGHPNGDYVARRYNRIKEDSVALINNPGNPSDISGDGAGDLLAVRPDGTLVYYPNNWGTNPGHLPFVGTGQQIGHGWTGFSTVLAADVSGDGSADIIAIRPDGTMLYYPNNWGSNAGGAFFTDGQAIGDGWNGFAKVTLGDVSGDGSADIIAVKPDGTMLYYPNNWGTNPGHLPFVGTGEAIGQGWNGFSTLLAIDISGDGHADMVGIKPDGTMLYYPNNSGTNPGHLPFVGTGQAIGAGWNGYTTVV